MRNHGALAMSRGHLDPSLFRLIGLPYQALPQIHFSASAMLSKMESSL